MLPTEQDGRSDPEPVSAGHVHAHERGLFTVVQNQDTGTFFGDRTANHQIDTAGHDGLQVDESALCSSRTPADEHLGTTASGVSQTEKEMTASSELPRKSKSRKRFLLWAFILVLVVVVAAVLGGVLGSRKRDGGSMSATPSSSGTSSTPSNPGTPSPTSTDIVTSSFIKQRSSLSVAAWRKNQGVEIFLYYQGSDGRLRCSTYDDTQSSSTYNQSYWGESKELEMDSGQSSAANDTTLAATIVLWDSEYEPQVDLFYLNSDAVVRAAYVVTNVDVQYYPYRTFNSAQLETAPGSYLAGYWPHFARINTDGDVEMWRNEAGSDLVYNQTYKWVFWTPSVPKPAMNGSRLAVVPLGSNMTSLSWWGNYGLFYQASDGKIAFTQPYRAEARANNTLVDSWPTSEFEAEQQSNESILNLIKECPDAEFPAITLADGGSFAAFTTSRPDSPDGLVNTYVLYQEISSRISMVYLDNNSNWVTQQPEALSTADNGTDIACVTMPMTQKDVNGNDLDLEQASVRTNRCYFQRGGQVIEVALNGTDWIELGTIPMD